MTMNDGVSRRDALSLLTKMATVLVAPISGLVLHSGRSREYSVQPDRDQYWLRPLLRKAEIIGEKYVRQIADGSGWRKTETELVNQNNLNTFCVDCLPNLTRRIRNDFRSGRTVRLEGWLISQTEATVCGLIYLHRCQFQIDHSS